MYGVLQLLSIALAYFDTLHTKLDHKVYKRVIKLYLYINECQYSRWHNLNLLMSCDTYRTLKDMPNYYICKIIAKNAIIP